MSLESLQRDGRAAYDKGDFSKALEYYNRAVGRGNPSPKLLDSVAATQVRLGDLNAALAAAKKTIQAGREDATGYLRAGQVLLKMEKASTALEIYAYGLKSIKHVGSGFERLKKAHDELLQQQAPKNSVDPLTVLPRELAIAVLEYLSFRQRVAVCQVSKGWTTFIRSEPNLWRHLDLSGAKRKVKTGFVSTAINVARKKITRATLNQLYDFDKVLGALVKHCPLESITLVNTGLHGKDFVEAIGKANKLKELVVLPGTEITATTLRRVLETQQSRLEVLKSISSQRVFTLGQDFRLQMPLLKSLDLQVSTGAHWEKLTQDLATFSPLLESLTLYESQRPASVAGLTPIDLRACDKLTYLNLRLMITSQRQLQLPKSMRVLKLATSCSFEAGSNFFGSGAETPEPNALHMWELPHLDEVHLNFPGLEFWRIALQFAIRTSDKGQRLSDLRSFRLQNTVIFDGRFEPFGILGRLCGVQQLGLTDCLKLEDRHVDALLQNSKRIEHLNLSSTSITGVAIKSIVRAGHVKRLVVNDCSHVGRDAVDWARQVGLQVEFKMTNNETGGKKVRY